MGDHTTDERATRDDRMLEEEHMIDDERTLDDDRALDEERMAGDRQVTADRPGARLLDGGDDWAGRWNEIQIRFVDEPQRSIEDADALVDEVIRQLMDRFADERQRLESQWTAGSEPSTEDLRVALQRYRSFFDRLLAA